MINRFKIFSKIMLLAMTSSLFAVNVTLNVDMSNVTVSDDGVHVAGSFQGWDPAATPLADDDGDGVYTVVVDMSGVTDETVYFKYINGNSWGNDESVSDLVCGGAGGFGSDRFLDVPDEDTVLDPVCFSECIGCDESYVTFHVDMEQTQVSEEGVFLGGGVFYPNFHQMTLVPDEETLYMIKIALPVGDHYYKFSNGANDAGFESGDNLSAEGCGDPNNWGDRTVSVGEIDSMTEPFCFGSCMTCITPVTANVTFQADMSVLISQGWDDLTHFLELRGGLNGWSAGDVFEQDLLDPNLYSFTKEVTAVPYSMHTWKFKANPDENFNNNGWETGADRAFYFTGEDMVLEPEVPAILPVGPLANAVEVEIHATWIEGTLNANSGEPFSMTPDTLIMNGSFLGGWFTWGNCMGSACSDPVSPDVPRLTDSDGDGIYVGTLSLPANHGNVFTYKLGAYYPGIENEGGDNGALDNEAGFGADKVFYIPTDASGTVALETVFGSNNPANPFLPRTITLNLDMTNHEVSEDGVHVAGSFQGWDPSATELMDYDNDGIYTVDFEANAGDTVYFKYINGNSWGNDESVTDPACGGAGGFGSDRFLIVPDVNTVLDPVCFGECISCDESYVVFHVDMEETPVATEGIFLGGGQWHNNYQLMTLVPEEETIYMVKMALSIGEHYYKFNNGGNDAGYEDGGNLTNEGCGDGDNWGDRTIVVGEEDSMTEPFCFSSCYTCGGDPVEANVTFQADMTTLLSQGWDDNTHFLELRGGVNGWSAGDVFEQDLLDPNLYSFTKSISAVPGSMHTWKFKANPDENFNNNGWETGADRTFEFTGEDIVLEADQPAILPIGELQNEVMVEIHATWMENTINVNTGEYFTGYPDTLIMNGSFLNCWCTWGDCMGSSCATVVSPDVPRLTDPDGDGVFTGSLTLPAGHGNVFTYKLGAYYPGIENEGGDNGALDNEAGFGADKVFYTNTDASGTVVLQTTFGDNNPDNPWIGTLASEEDQVVTPKEFALRGNHPNPFNPVTTLRFDLDYTSKVNVTVYNVLGNEVITLQNGELIAGTYAIQWNANNSQGQKVPSGLYLYKVTSDNRILTGKMLLMK